MNELERLRKENADLKRLLAMTTDRLTNALEAVAKLYKSSTKEMAA